MSIPTIYYAIVAPNDDVRLDWTPCSAFVATYLYHHHTVKLLISRQTPGEQTDDHLLTTIESQVTLENTGLAPYHRHAAGSRLIATLEALLSEPLAQGADHYQATHAKRLAYLSLYLADLKDLPPRDTNLLLLTAYLHDFKHHQVDSNGRDGLRRFNRFLAGQGSGNQQTLDATLTAILANAGQAWRRQDTNLLIHVLAATRLTPHERQLHAWAADIRRLDTLRFGHPVDLATLHDRDAMRLLYASHQEYQLIPDPKTKEYLP